MKAFTNLKLYTCLIVSCIVFISAITLSGCMDISDADKATENMKQEAESFNILRRFVLINTRTDKVEFELVGAFSREEYSSSTSQVTLIVDLGDDNYRRHIIKLNEDTMYIIEDLGPAKNKKSSYQVNYIPNATSNISIEDILE